MQIDPNNSCFFDCGPFGSEFYTFSPSKRANTIIYNILAKVGLKPNFKLLTHASVENAMASFLNDGTKVIFYNEDYINKIDTAVKGNWAFTFILAHEMGHHLNAHKLNDLEKRPENELLADEFAGFMLYRLGANLTETLSALNNTKLASGCATHPPRATRLLSAKLGWAKAKEEEEAKNKIISQRVRDLEIRITSIKKSTNSIDVILKFIGAGEKYGTGYALKADGSDGIADYWKFFPYARGKLVDNLGNAYGISSITGMGYARDLSDWTMLKTEENSTASISFSKNSSSKIGDTFDFYLEIWVAYVDDNLKTAKMAYTLSFRGIKLQL